MFYRLKSVIHTLLPPNTFRLAVAYFKMTAQCNFDPNVSTNSAIFAQGCFWGPDGIYGVIPGVIRTRVGYTGGKQANPTYRNIGDHTEAFVVEYNPEMTNYSNLLMTFWSSHDPTLQHKTQYKSAIYYIDDKEKQLAEDTLKEEQKRYSRKIVTEILPASTFYNAEDYHQKYVLRSHHSLFHSLNFGDGEALLKNHVATRLNGYLSGHGSMDTFEKESALWGLSAEHLAAIRKIMQAGTKVVCH